MYMNEKRWGRLQQAIDWSLLEMQHPRRKRIESVGMFCGGHYMSGGGTESLVHGNPVPVPFLSLATMIFVRKLAANAPQCLMEVDELQHAALANDFQHAVNAIPEEIGLTWTLRQLVTEAMFAPWGIVKVGVNGGKMFADICTLDDYFIDMSASRVDQIDFEGNDYWMNYEDIMESDKYTGKDQMQPDERTPVGSMGEDRTDTHNQGTAKTFRDKKWCRDIWIPDEGLLVTTTVLDKKVIREADLDELRHSPYYRLSFVDAPGKLMPVPSVDLWRDLHELGNALFTKLANGADAQKTCLGFHGDDDGVASFQSSADGDGFNYQGPEPKILKAGGIDSTTLAFFMQTRDLMSYFAGNLDSLGGLGAVTETAAQDKLISGAANVQIDDMSDKTIAAVKRIFEALAYYEWNDPHRVRLLHKKIPGTDLTVPFEFGPNKRNIADYGKFKVGVNIHSMQSDSPQTKLAKLRAIVTEFIMPLAGPIQQGGGTIDVKKILKKAGQYADFDEAEELVAWVENLGAEGGETHAPAVTERTYNRTGSPGPSPQSSNQQMIQSLMKSGSN